MRRDESSNIFVSLVISSCIWSSLTVLNAGPLVRARPKYLRRYKSKLKTASVNITYVLLLSGIKITADIFILVI